MVLKDCIICRAAAVYRCSKCVSSYCGTTCFKAHKESCASAVATKRARSPISKTECPISSFGPEIPQGKLEGIKPFAILNNKKILNSIGDNSTTVNNSDLVVLADNTDQARSVYCHDDDRAEDRHKCDGDTEVEDSVLVLQPRHLRSMCDSPDVMAAMTSCELRKLVKFIDKSPARLEALSAAIFNIPEFSEFCSNVLRAIKRADQLVV